MGRFVGRFAERHLPGIAKAKGQVEEEDEEKREVAR
jgi:hypothetical protein